MDSDGIVLLKRFGIRVVNKEVKAHKVDNLWHVYYLNEWHRVPEEDVEEIATN